jgi:hypothetical protein
MSETIYIDEAEVIRHEPCSIKIDDKVTDSLSLVVKQSTKTEMIKQGSEVEHQGRPYVVYEKKLPLHAFSPIIYLTLLGPGNDALMKKGGRE